MACFYFSSEDDENRGKSEFLRELLKSGEAINYISGRHNIGDQSVEF